MNKFGAQDDDIMRGLRDEEAQLMVKMSAYMTDPVKYANESTEMRTVEARLHQVRAKISEFDLGKNKQE